MSWGPAGHVRSAGLVVHQQAIARRAWDDAGLLDRVPELFGIGPEALANKIARVAWALLVKGEVY
jgi:hypothetical protein